MSSFRFVLKEDIVLKEGTTIWKVLLVGVTS